MPPTPLPLSNPWRKTSYRYWHHLLTTWPRYLQAWWQRARDGYSTPDTWGFDTYLARVIAGGLRHLADNCHGVPGTYTSEDRPLHESAALWIADLEAAALKLEEYVDDEIPSHEEEQHRYEEAKDAMRWVAENFGSLWD